MRFKTVLKNERLLHKYRLFTSVIAQVLFKLMQQVVLKGYSESLNLGYIYKTYLYLQHLSL